MGDLLTLFTQLGISLGLGLLVGLQREKTSSEIAGVRTVPLITLWGTMSAWLSLELGGWVIAASILALVALVVLANVYLLRSGYSDGGLTSEIAIPVMFCVGALVVVGPRPLAIAIGGGVAVLLHAKEWLHGISDRLDRDDLAAIMRFALIALVILPILPDRPFGPFSVLNLREIWWMVVLIVGISLGGYIAYRFMGARAGTLLGGILGGIISSTATTVSYSKRARAQHELTRSSAVVIMIANALVMVRILIEVRVAGPRLFPAAVWPVSIMLAVQLALAGVAWWNVRNDDAQLPRQQNPAELKPALIFGALFALVMMGVAATKEWFGNSGLYAVAMISGLTDVDPITLSAARLAQGEEIDLTLGWRVIVLAAMSNLVFKTAIVGFLGNARAFRLVAAFSAVAIVTGALLLAFWR